MASSIKKVVAQGPNFDVIVNFMDNGSLRLTIPDGPWAILGAFSTGKGPSQIRFVKVEEE
jgi:hypothetical protein